jgi:hypothetical protein
MMVVALVSKSPGSRRRRRLRQWYIPGTHRRLDAEWSILEGSDASSASDRSI